MPYHECGILLHTYSVLNGLPEIRINLALDLIDTLKEYRILESGIIQEVLDHDLALLLLNRGVMKGSSFKLIAKTPFKGPFVIEAEGQFISIRFGDLSNIKTCRAE